MASQISRLREEMQEWSEREGRMGSPVPPHMVEVGWKTGKAGTMIQESSLEWKGKDSMM